MGSPPRSLSRTVISFAAGSCLSDLLGAIAFLDDAAGRRPTSRPWASTTGKVRKPKWRSSIMPSTSPTDSATETVIGSWIEAVDVPLDAGNLLDLLLALHVVMDQAMPPFSDMAIAICDPVTVSMSDEMIGICRRSVSDRFADRSASFGRISE